MNEPPNLAEQKLTALVDGIEAREENLRRQLVGYERRALLEIIRAIDSIGYFRAFAPNHKLSDLPGFLDASWLGANRALSLFLPEGMIGPGAIFGRTNDQVSMWASSLLYSSGLISHLKRLVDLVHHDLAVLELTSAGTLRFVITAPDLEAIDREAIEWFAGHVRNKHRSFLDALEADRGAWVSKELKTRVEKDPFFGIRYSSCRELEEYFEAQAELRSHALPGNDAIPDSCKIGPLTFGQYRTAAVTGIARCMKHTAFVDTLLARPSPPAARDILTIYSFDHELREQWGGLLGLNDDETDTMLEVLGISTLDIQHLKSVPDCPQALLIRGGDQCWHKPIFGGLNSPFPWMTRKLQRMFRPDWDRAVNLREAAFRQDLRALFPEPRFFMPPKPRVLRAEGRTLTDIDALVFDRITGTVAVFQLKWQDAFETSLKERASRQKNLSREGNSWVEIVSEYCLGLSANDRALKLGLPKEMAASAKAMCLFVLTRNGARFSGGETQDKRAAWFSWYDLLRHCHGMRADKDPLLKLWEEGQRAYTQPRQSAPETFEIDGVKIETVRSD